MPIYDFKCPRCEAKFDKYVSSATERVECPLCGTMSHKQLSVPAAPQFKGSGFYATDFKNK